MDRARKVDVFGISNFSAFVEKKFHGISQRKTFICFISSEMIDCMDDNPQGT